MLRTQGRYRCGSAVRNGCEASDNVNALVPPVGKILRFVVSAALTVKDEESASTAPAASMFFSYVCHCLKIPCGSEKGAIAFLNISYTEEPIIKIIAHKICFVSQFYHLRNRLRSRLHHSGGDCTDFRPCCKLLLSIWLCKRSNKMMGKDVAGRTKSPAIRLLHNRLNVVDTYKA